MKPIIRSLFLAATLLISVIASAQNTTPPNTNNNNNNNNGNNTDQNSNPRFWQATFPNGSYLVKLDRISSASKHEYISDGVAHVIEVTIGTDSAVVARFYYLEPVGKDTAVSAGSIIIERAQSLAQDAASRVSPTAGKLNVVKNYPTSTHAHTVEYVVQSAATLDSLYASLMAAINSNRGRTWVSSEK